MAVQNHSAAVVWRAPGIKSLISSSSAHVAQRLGTTSPMKGSRVRREAESFTTTCDARAGLIRRGTF